VLVAFTRSIQECLREYDCLGRYGGEEFIVLALGDAGQTAEGLYERLCSHIADTEIKTSAGPVSITVSIGVEMGNSKSTVDALLTAADAALYRAKAGGRNRVAS
jgi:two-component system, cell cycle response regulator